jgi:hypothetical protein
MVLGNKSREKLGTLIDSAHAQTIRATTADCPDRGLSGPRTVRPQGRTVHAALFSVQHMPPCLLVKVDEPKAYELNLM